LIILQRQIGSALPSALPSAKLVDSTSDILFCKWNYYWRAYNQSGYRLTWFLLLQTNKGVRQQSFLWWV